MKVDLVPAHAGGVKGGQNETADALLGCEDQAGVGASGGGTAGAGEVVMEAEALIVGGGTGGARGRQCRK